jgi:nitrogenase molybdenum-iron protein alpha chain
MSSKPKTVDGITRESTQQMIDEALEAYPEKARKKRAPR